MAPRGGRQASRGRGGARGGSRAKSRQQTSARSSDRQQQAPHGRDRRRSRPEVAEKAAAVDDEDEEIDEDEAFDEEDEMKYGDLFSRVKSKRSAGKEGEGDDDEDDEDGDDDGSYEEYDDDVERELLAAGGTLLSDLLSGTSATPSASSKQKGRKAKRSASDDEDDDAEYSQDNDDEYDDGDDDDDGEGPNSGLLDVVQKLSSQKDRRAEAGSKTDVSQLTSSVDISGGLSMDALVGALKDTQGYSGVAQSLLKLNSSATSARPVEAVTDARAARKALYAQSAEDIAKWQETVAANRSAKTLDLAQDKRDYVRNTTAQDAIKRFKPTSELEQDVEMILVQANAHGPGLDRQEEDELEAAELTLEELKERRAEIEKARALMTYYQRKRHQINKIKSKAYRKIRKKQKLRQQDKERELIEEADPELAAQLAEADAVRRLEERMSLRHKNTSKWAKMALAHGGTSNESFREALQEQLLLGEELRKRINMEGNQSGDEDDDNSDADVSHKAAVAAAKERLLALDDEDKTTEVDSKYSKLFQMKFMQRKATEQKEQAKRDAQALLEELEALSDDDAADSDDESAKSSDESGKPGKGDDADGKTANGESAKKAQASKEEREAAKKKIAEMMASGSFQMQGSAFGVRVNSALAVQVDRPQSTQSAPKAQQQQQAEDDEEETSEAGGTSNPWLAAPSRERKSVTKARGGKKKDEVHVDVSAAVESLVKKNDTAAPENETTHSKSKKRRAQVAGTEDAVIGSEGAAIVPPSKPATDDAAAMDGFGKRAKQETQPAPKGKAKKEPLPGEDPAAGPKKLVSVLSQNELIEMAFVAPDLEEDFRKAKEAEIDDELDITKRKKEELQNDKKGWGTWAGLGAAPMSAGAKRRRDERIKKLEDEDNKKKMARKDAKMPNVMVSERRVKLASKYKVGDIPHPFTSREQYERAMQMPVGPEWNTSQIVRKHTKPEVITKSGRIIEPITLPKSAKKKAAATAR